MRQSFLRAHPPDPVCVLWYVWDTSHSLTERVGSARVCTSIDIPTTLHMVVEHDRRRNLASVRDVERRCTWKHAKDMAKEWLAAMHEDLMGKAER